MTTPKRIVAYHIARLRDRNPEIRLRAINELALLADPDALEPLQEVFRNDSDQEVRKAAQEAGRAIYLKRQNEQRAK